jgi:DNA topoisomerase I
MAKKSTKSRSSAKRQPSGNGKSVRSSATPRSTSGGGKHLVIVESPAKARTINRYLGNDYLVMASVGHVRDLPTRPPKGAKRADHPVPGVDIEHDFKPTYEVIKGKSKTVTDLKRAAKQADEVFLATDLDREGEAIAWHLAEALGIDIDRARRVVFNAITKDEIHRAFENPRHLDMDKVNAQQARRILDRIVGYQVSPLLWKKVAGGLSAGRVQSVALRLVVEREREILAFIPDEYWKITGYFTVDLDHASHLAAQWIKWLDDAPETKNGRPVDGRSQRDKLAWLAEHKSITAELVEVAGKKFEADNVDLALKIAQQAGFSLDDKQITEDPDAKGPAQRQITLRGATAADLDWRIKSLETKRNRSRPYAPFITSTLQQNAANQLGFTAFQTMRTAQQLYEGVEIRGSGSVGLITYMRTDSTHLSAEALTMARGYISQTFGDKYLPDKPNFYASSNKDAQEAHEAIRPTDVSLHPDSQAVKNSLDERQLKLYRLIWQRFVASQMTPAEWDTTTYLITAADLVFRGSGRVLVFDGFYKVVGIPHPADEAILPPLTQNQRLAPLQVDPTQHFTNPPPRYTEASIVKKLESEGIGRPSTYASIIETITKRNYVEKISGRFHATDLGMVVNDKLVEAFPKIMDVGYTREMEAQLDRIEDQHHDWVEMLRKFYGPFKENLDTAHDQLSHAKAETIPAPEQYKCPTCDAPTEYRFGKNGRFLSCTRYPDCKYAAPVDRHGKPQEPERTDIACPVCNSPMLLKKGRFGPFLSCSNYPECKGIVNLDRKGHIKHPSPPPLLTDLTCPKCESPLNLRRSKRGPWLSCSTFPKCRGRLAWTKLDEATQKKLETALAAHERQHPQPTIKTTAGKPVGDEYTPANLGSAPSGSANTADAESLAEVDS